MSDSRAGDPPRLLTKTQLEPLMRASKRVEKSITDYHLYVYHMTIIHEVVLSYETKLILLETETETKAETETETDTSLLGWSSTILNVPKLKAIRALKLERQIGPIRGRGGHTGRHR